MHFIRTIASNMRITTAFYHSNLHHSNLHHSNLHHSNLHHSNLHHSNLHHSNLHHSNLHHSNLHHSNLHHSNLHHSNLHHSNLHHSTCYPYANLSPVLQVTCDSASSPLTNNNKGTSAPSATILAANYELPPSRAPLSPPSKAKPTPRCHGYADYDEVATPCDDILLPPPMSGPFNSLQRQHTRTLPPSSAHHPSFATVNTIPPIQSSPRATPPPHNCHTLPLDTGNRRPPGCSPAPSSSASLPRLKTRSFRTLHRVFRGLRRSRSQGHDREWTTSEPNLGT